MTRVAICALVVLVVSSAFAGHCGCPNQCTRLVVHDFWVNEDTGMVIGPATGAPPKESIAEIPRGCCAMPVDVALAQRQVTRELCDGEIMKVVRTYFVGVVLANGVPTTAVSKCGIVYNPTVRVVRRAMVDREAGARIKCWRIVRDCD